MRRLIGILAEVIRPARPVNLESRIEPTVPRHIVASPFEAASDELAGDGARRFMTLKDSVRPISSAG